MSSVPLAEIPSHMVQEFPVVRSSVAAITLGPVMVYSRMIVLRFEATNLSESRRPRPELAPTRREPDNCMFLRCFIERAGRRVSIEATLIRNWTTGYDGRVASYFALDTGTDFDRLLLNYSYEQMGLGLVEESIDGAAIEGHRAAVGNIQNRSRNA